MNLFRRFTADVIGLGIAASSLESRLILESRFPAVFILRNSLPVLWAGRAGPVWAGRASPVSISCLELSPAEDTCRDGAPVAS